LPEFVSAYLLIKHLKSFQRPGGQKKARVNKIEQSEAAGTSTMSPGQNS
jgi:hypothetical protein